MFYYFLLFFLWFLLVFLWFDMELRMMVRIPMNSYGFWPAVLLPPTVCIVGTCYANASLFLASSECSWPWMWACVQTDKALVVCLFFSRAPGIALMRPQALWLMTATMTATTATEPGQWQRRQHQNQAPSIIQKQCGFYPREGRYPVIEWEFWAPNKNV